MIQLQNKPLSAKTIQVLNKRQGQINDQPDYPARVKFALKSWDNWHSRKEVLKTLREIAPRGRCYYCEADFVSQIDHFHPKSLYPELTYEWDNFIYSCAICNSRSVKADKFAVMDEYGVLHDVTRHSGTPIEPPLQGMPALINPRFENPLDFMRLDLDKFIFVPRLQSTRARYTIDTLQLNSRANLIEDRRTFFGNFKNWVYGYYFIKQQGDENQLAEHRNQFNSYWHWSVWDEMRRMYRHERFHDLKIGSPNLLEVEKIFTLVPEALDISPIPQ